MPDNIITVERTESVDALVMFYNCADVFINPTYLDNFPTTNIEALACGIPVITYNTGGSPEAIDDYTGLIVEKGNIEDLLAAVNSILKNGKSFYSSACRERAINYFNKDDRYYDYYELYSRLIK